MTETNGIQEYDIDISANSEEQAKTSFMDIYNILENPKWKEKMKKNFRWNREEIVNKKTNSKIKFRTNSPKGKDGLRSAMVCFDEVHQYENWDNINVFTTGLGKKPCPRRLYITTDGYIRDAVIDELKDKSKKILNGEIEDYGFCPFICKLDDEEEVHDESNWYKCNPSLYQNIGLQEQMKKEYLDFKENPYINSSFMTKRCNIPMNKEEDSPVTEWENILATNQDIPDLKGYDCCLGIDYSKVNDFVSVSFLFKKDGKYYVKSHSWVCTRSADLPRIKAPLNEWANQGLLTFVDDVEIPINMICEYIQEELKNYNLIRIGVDNFRLSLLSKGLQDIGIDTKDKEICKLVRPSDIMKIVPVIDSLFNNKELIYGDNPLLRWATNNTMLIDKGNSNFVYGKVEYKSRKTDPFMSCVHAIIASQDYLEDTGGGDLIFMNPWIF